MRARLLLAAVFLVATAAVALVPGARPAAASPSAEAAGGGRAPAGASTGWGYVAAALAVGLGSIGAGFAVGPAASAAVGAVAEKSEMTGKALVFVGLAEGIAIYGLVVAILILNRL